MNTKTLYFDTAATTPIDKNVAILMNKINLESFGNPSSIHTIGQKSHNIIERSRISIAKILNCQSSEIFFTSGGSESNNIILKGVLSQGDHFITSSYEHPSILGLSDYLRDNNVEVSLVNPDSNGIIQPNKIKALIRKNTKLISIMYVNNELGTTNPIKEITDMALNNNLLFHTDAVQFVGKERVNLSSLNLHFMSIGAHKFYGPKGIGILYIKNGHHINPLVAGGGQESGLRAGTENVSSIAGMNLALKISEEHYDNHKNHILKMEQIFLKELDSLEIDYRLNGVNRIPGILNITFFNVDGHALLMNLDMKDISISYGAACSSGSASPPLALLEIGLPKEEAKCSVRISIGRMIDKDDIHYLIKSISQIINNIKK